MTAGAAGNGADGDGSGAEGRDDTGAGGSADTAAENASAADVDQERLAELLDEIEELTDTEAEREQVRETVEERLDIDTGPFGRVIRGFDRGDLAETLLGSVLFGIPMAVEGGTQEVGAHMAANPLAIGATVVFTVALVIGILYVSDLQDVRVHEPIFGIVPRRLVGVLAVSSGTAVAMLTVWGRVEWASPVLALATCTAAFVPMAIGAALSDILPGT
ncbi:MAG: DUF2391 domain-containing protein [Haloferacaceae archaeon]